MSRNALPYYKRYPRDLIEGTIGMPFEEKVTYAFILDLIYLQNGKLPDDARYIAGLLGVSVRKWNKLRSALVESGKLQIIGEFLTNYRAVIELERMGKYQDNQAENRRVSNKNNDLTKPASNQKTTSARLYTEPEPNAAAGQGNASARENTKSADPAPPKPADLTERESILKAMGYEPENGFGFTPNGGMVGSMTDMREYQAWRDDLGLTFDEVVETITEITARRKGQRPPVKFKFFTGAMQDLAGLKEQGPLQPNAAPPRPTGSNGKGSRHERAVEHHRNDAAFRETIRRVESGEVQLGSGRRSPFGD